MSWVFGSQRDLSQDKISYVETPWLHHCIILPGHEVLVLCCPVLCICPYLVYQIEVQTELLLIILVLIYHHPVIGHMYFYRYDCFASIG